MDAFDLTHERLAEQPTPRPRPAGLTPAELEHVYRRDGGRFRALAASIAGPERAADAVQEAFAQALRKRSSWRGDGPAEAWLWRLVLHAAHDAERRRLRRDRLARRLLVLAEHRPAAAASVDDRLRAPIRRLSRRQRDCLVLRYYGDLSYDEIGAALGVSPGTVGALLARAHAALRIELEKEDRE